MKFRLGIGDNDREVEIARGDEKNSAEVTIDGVANSVRVSNVSSQELSVDWGGRKRKLCFADTAEGTWVFSEGKSRLVSDLDRAAPKKRGARGAGDGPGIVTPVTPSVVVRVMVETGQKVEKGQPVVVVTAMKMETTLVAPYAGAVTAINTSVDARVNPGDLLVEIEREETEDGGE